MMNRTAHVAVIGASALAVVAVLGLAGPAVADQLPAPSQDYEAEALELCPTGHLECVEETLDALRQHTRTLAQNCDHDAIFAALYTVVTEHYHATVEDDGDFFLDTAFVNREDMVFAHFYFWPYVNWHNDLRSAVPPAWQVAFRAADAEDVSAAGNLLLGVNAHVVRDLPFVLAGLDLGRKEDHDRVNDILREAYEPAIRAIDEHLADSVDDYNVDGSELDDDALFQLVTSWREQAWQDAQRLTDATTRQERDLVGAEIEEKARVQAVTFAEQFRYPPGSDWRERRNAYCAENAWPPDWLGGD